MNKDNINFREDQLEEILKTSVRIDPPSGIEENVMKKIHSSSKEKNVSWVFIAISTLFAVLIISVIIFPGEFGIVNSLGSRFSLESLNIFDTDSFRFIYDKPYLVMSMVVFAGALWMLISFNLPKTKSTDFDQLYCL